MSLSLDLDLGEGVTNSPTVEQFKSWLDAALSVTKKQSGDYEISLLVVNAASSQQLNLQYRNQDKPTNVLSFAAELPDFVKSPLLGDLVICAPIVEKEALEQGKKSADHWAHLTIHGCLHLLGYDHLAESQAEEMETLEIQALEKLGIANPYLID